MFASATQKHNGIQGSELVVKCFDLETGNIVKELFLRKVNDVWFIPCKVCDLFVGAIYYTGNQDKEKLTDLPTRVYYKYCPSCGKLLKKE